MHSVVVVLQVCRLLELLDTGLVHFLGVAVALEAQAEAGLTIVRISRSKEHKHLLLAESVLDVAHRSLEDVSVIAHRHKSLSGDAAARRQDTVAIFVELLCEKGLSDTIRQGIGRVDNNDIVRVLGCFLNVSDTIAEDQIKIRGVKSTIADLGDVLFAHHDELFVNINHSGVCQIRMLKHFAG